MIKPKKYLCFLLLISILPNLVMAQDQKTNEKPIELPKDIQGAKEFVNNFVTLLPEAIKNAWEQTLTFWAKLFEKIKTFWASSLEEKIREVNVIKFITQEFKNKYSSFNEELKKEIQGTKQDILMLIENIRN